MATADVQELLQSYGYDIVELIGQGGYAECYKVYSHQYKQFFACKVMLLPEKHKKERQASFQNECDALTNILHPYIIHVYKTIVTETCVILILEYCANGNLYQYVMRNGVYKDVTKLLSHLQMILSAIKYLEENHLAHNDIKPANILIDHYGRLKLADFGLTKRFVDDEVSEDYRGSLAFASPEIVSHQPYNPFKANVWSFGVMVYFLVVGKPPFPTDSIQGFQEKMLQGYYDIPQTIDRMIAKIIKGCLIVDPEKRLTFNDIQRMVEEALGKAKSHTGLPHLSHNYLHKTNQPNSLIFGKRIQKMKTPILRPQSFMI